MSLSTKLNSSTLTALEKLRHLSHHNYGFNSDESQLGLEEKFEDTYEPILEGTLGRLKLAFEKQRKTKVTDSARMHCVIAHAPAHKKWAEHLKLQLDDSINDILPCMHLTIEPLCITGSLEEITQTITEYLLPYGPGHYPGHVFIVTLGWWESQMITAVKAKAELDIPQLFCVPGMPGQMFNNEHSVLKPHLIGGVANTPMSPESYVHSVLGFDPEADWVCIAYDPNPSNEVLALHLKQQVADIEAAFRARKIVVERHHWSPDDVCYASLDGKLITADAVIVFQEPSIEAHRELLIHMCNARKTFICASELDTVLAGAALGCGITGAAFGIPLAGLIVDYVLNPAMGFGWAVHQIPEQSGMCFNEWAFGLQGVDLDNERMALLQMKSAFERDCIRFS